MMAYPADPARTFVLRARRDTVLLIVAVTATTFALSSAIHSRPAEHGVAAQQHWTGDLTDLAADEAPAADRELLTSASLVVPASDLSLPQVPVRALVKLHGCDGSICPPRTAVPVPVRRPSANAEPANVRRVPRHAKQNLMARLNPLNHLPDISRITHPFTVAGDTVSGWFRRF